MQEINTLSSREQPEPSNYSQCLVQTQRLNAASRSATDELPDCQTAASHSVMDKMTADCDCWTAQTGRRPGNMQRGEIGENYIASFRSPCFFSVRQIAN